VQQDEPEVWDLPISPPRVPLSRRRFQKGRLHRSRWLPQSPPGRGCRHFRPTRSAPLATRHAARPIPPRLSVAPRRRCTGAPRTRVAPVAMSCRRSGPRNKRHAPTDREGSARAIR
jgi:hypothetical protein